MRFCYIWKINKPWYYLGTLTRFLLELGIGGSYTVGVGQHATLHCGAAFRSHHVVIRLPLLSLVLVRVTTVICKHRSEFTFAHLNL